MPCSPAVTTIKPCLNSSLNRGASTVVEVGIALDQNARRTSTPPESTPRVSFVVIHAGVILYGDSFVGVVVDQFADVSGYVIVAGEE